MPTLIHLQRNGRTIARCDARCHDALTKKCRCICLGRNHGCGYSRALQNNKRHFAEINRTVPPGHLRIALPLRQTNFLTQDPPDTAPAAPP